MKPLYQMSALEIRDAFLQGELKAVEIAEHFLKRAKDSQEILGSFLEILEVKAMTQAERLDQKRGKGAHLGKMAAIPVAIKDNMHLEGEKTTCASKILANYKAPFSATAVRKMAEEDALFIGKTNLDEFAMGSTNEKSAFFPCKNPWNVQCVPGGSSGGSAAAVSARLSLLATGTDTGGSIRQPAAFTGVVGFKPTYGRVSRYGLVAFGSSLDQIGPFATNVADAALMMETIGSHCTHDATSLDLPNETYLLSKTIEPMTVGISYPFLEGLRPEVRKNFDQAIDALVGLGAKTVEVDLSILKHSISVYYILATAEASTNLARYDGIRFGHRAKGAKTLDEVYEISRQEGFGREVKRRIMLGTYVLSAGYQDAYYRKAQQVRTLIMESFDQAFAQCDVIAMPVATSGAFEMGAIHDPLEIYLQDIFTIPANLAGLPAVSVPSGYDDRGMPLGLQLIGPQMCDVPLLQYAYAYEQATNHYQIPSLFDRETFA